MREIDMPEEDFWGRFAEEVPAEESSEDMEESEMGEEKDRPVAKTPAAPVVLAGTQTSLPPEAAPAALPAEPSSGKSEAEDWKSKYEQLDAERKNREYLNELRLLDEELEGETLEEIRGGERYRELREMGLSPKAAYGAYSAETEEKTGRRDSAGKSHVSGQTLRGSAPRARMDRETRSIVSELLEDMSEEKREELYRRVTAE